MLGYEVYKGGGVGGGGEDFKNIVANFVFLYSIHVNARFHGTSPQWLTVKMTSELLRVTGVERSLVGLLRWHGLGLELFWKHLIKAKPLSALDSASYMLEY